MFDFLDMILFWITAITILIYLYLKYYVYNYWQRHGVPVEQPSIPLGNIPVSYFFGKISLGNFIKKNYDKFSKHPFHGFYAFYKPVLIINDPELIRTIFIKEFHRFPDRGWYSNEKLDPLSRNLFLLSGNEWKKLRVKLSPAFTSGRLKQMYQVFVEVSNEMIQAFEVELKQSNILDVKDLIERYTMDIISSIIYGFNCNSLKDSNTQFRRFGKSALDFRRLNLLLAIFIPDFLPKLKLSFNKIETNKYFLNVFNDEIKHSNKKNIVIKDLLIQLMYHEEMKDEKNKNDHISNENSEENLEKISMVDAAAQAFGLFMAGFEAAASTVTYCLIELAMNPEIQEKLREEINQMEDTTGITYDSVMGNEYLEMVLTESVRKHPIAAFIDRTCTEDFLIPNSNFTIPRGMRVLTSASGIHRNSEFYPDPEKFDPLRFSKENGRNRNAGLRLEFGLGPRYCIGKRFGKLESKLAIVMLLRSYKFNISEKTDITTQYSTTTFVQIPSNKVFLHIERTNQVINK